MNGINVIPLDVGSNDWAEQPEAKRIGPNSDDLAHMEENWQDKIWKNRAAQISGTSYLYS